MQQPYIQILCSQSPQTAKNGLVNIFGSYRQTLAVQSLTSIRNTTFGLQDHLFPAAALLQP